MYQILIKPSASKELQKLPENEFIKIDKAILSLSDNPRPVGCLKLMGEDKFWRIRKGDYRIIYTLDDSKKTITILKIKHRKEVYR